MHVSLQITALAVSAIYYLWRDGYVVGRQRDCRLRQRVAYMLWAAALHDVRPLEEPPTAPTAV
jgi:hypothetical protein